MRSGGSSLAFWLSTEYKVTTVYRGVNSNRKNSLRRFITIHGFYYLIRVYAMRKNGIIPDMGRPADKNREERVPVQIPKSWMKLARKLASDAKQPVLWFILGMIAEKAQESDVEHPVLPWEVSEE